jgi:hypothetical protein
MDSLMTSGYCSGTLLSRAPSMRVARSFMYWLKSKEGLLLLFTSDRTVTSATQRGRCTSAGQGEIDVRYAVCERACTEAANEGRA